MGQDGEDGQSEPVEDPEFEDILSTDRKYEQSVRRRMFVTWIAIFVVMALWWLVMLLFD